MTYEEALQIAIEQLDDAVDYLKAMNRGFPKIEKQVDELVSASNVLRKELEQPEREWVGLEDDWGIGKFYHPDFLVGAEWAEKKLKEKNT